MGRLARVLSSRLVERRGVKFYEVKVDPGGGANVVAEQYTGPGLDGRPQAGDYAILTTFARSGGYVIVGYVEAQDVGDPGSVRLRARGANGHHAVSWLLRSDGSALLENDNGYIELRESGAVEINGATITPGGDVVSASGNSLDDHGHDQLPDSDSDNQERTGPAVMPANEAGP